MARGVVCAEPRETARVALRADWGVGAILVSVALFAPPLRGDGAGRICRLGGKHGISHNRRAVHQTVQVKVERMVVVFDKTLAQKCATCLAQVDDFLLMVEALGVGAL